MRLLAFSAAVLIFQALPLTATAVNASTAGIPGDNVAAESYFREPTASTFLYTHILFVVLSWVIALPLSVVLHIAGSKLRYPVHVTFLVLHVIGIIPGLIYASRTPDLYPGSSHNNLGWLLTALVSAHFLAGVSKSFTKHGEPDIDHELTPFISTEEPERESPSSDEHSGSSPRDVSPNSARSNCSSEETDTETLLDVHLHYNSRREQRFNEPMSWKRRWLNISEPHFFIQLLDTAYDVVLRFLLVLGFVGICTGIVTMAGIFHGKHVFNGLAHFIKGGVIFWFGILTLGRWMGCFSARGWAWNLPSFGRKNTRSMEFMECSIIFLYGITNVFLEHLSNWGGAWSPSDFEHVAISLLFIGGGLCGFMVESRAFGTQNMHLDDDEFSKPENVQPRIRINPIPAMIIFLLGLILAGHHQNSKESTMMHNQVGNLLAIASAARCITYLLLHISPPTSEYPSRPPSELVCSFSLMCGGIMLMASNKDTVQAMIDNQINAMLASTVTMGLVAMLMACIIFVLGVKGWASARQE